MGHVCSRSMPRKRRHKEKAKDGDDGADEDHEGKEGEFDEAPIACVTRHGSLVVASAGSRIVAHDVSTGECTFASETSNEAHTAPIRSLCFSRDGEILASGADDKLVKVWDVATWKCYLSKPLVKKVTAVVLTADAAAVVGSDKFGDVCSFAATRDGADEDPKFLLGHMSLVTTMVLNPSCDRLITADRDEHIRVSHFPDGFDIDMMCLGHKTFVTALLVHPLYPELLISGDGHGGLRVWRYLQGQETASLQVPMVTGGTKADGKPAAVLSVAASSKTGTIAAVCEGLQAVFCFTISSAGELAFSRTIPTERCGSGLCIDDDEVLWVASSACQLSDNTITPHLQAFEGLDSNPKAVTEHKATCVINAGLAEHQVTGSMFTEGVQKGVCHKGVHNVPKRMKTEKE